MKKNIKNICCIGAGYVGGPTMAVIAKKCPHIQINVVDINKKRIEDWNSEDLASLPIFEPGLGDIIKSCRNKNLHFSTDIKKQIANADMIFISVNTPTKTKGIGAGKASDLKWVESSAREISKYAVGSTIIVEKSTLPVKTALTIKRILESQNNKLNTKSVSQSFAVLSNPEFMSEGSAIKDLENPDRVLIGGEDQEAIKELINIYLNWVDFEKILTTDLWSSELSKLIANAFLAQRISSINSMTALCEKTGADIKNVSLAIGSDKRIGQYFLDSGPGFGGSCFKKDILNLVYICNHYGLDEVSSYWQKVVDINIWQQKRISHIVVDKLFRTVSGKKIAIFGFAFKSNTNDTRESPAISICNDLIEEGSNIYIYDPKVRELQIEKDLGVETNKKYSRNNDDGYWHYSKSIDETIKEADAIIILTGWSEFKKLNYENIFKLMRSPSWIFDARGILDPNHIQSIGFRFWRIGLGNQNVSQYFDMQF
tara:strand:- start:805 stop:2256 length:1452 start_codon:yes stop_codon:yes gene_type:complete